MWMYVRVVTLATKPQELHLKTSPTHPETALLLAITVAVLLACLGPAIAQHAHYHVFADQRTALGVPYAMDVWSNLPFAVGGVWGLIALQGMHAPSVSRVQKVLAALFFVGLLCTALCSSVYHWSPNNTGLTWDRLGMVVAFAGLLGWSVVDRISARAGVWVAGAVLLLGALSVGVWATTANLLPWVVLQGGGMLLLLVLAMRKPVQGAWGLPLLAVISIYAVAKVLELQDHAVYAWTQGLVSGHSLKHLVAAAVAWPLIAVVHNAPQSQ